LERGWRLRLRSRLRGREVRGKRQKARIDRGAVSSKEQAVSSRE
jgi:hypothetical protein